MFVTGFYTGVMRIVFSNIAIRSLYSYNGNEKGKKKKKICLSKDLNQSVLHSIKVLITKTPGHMKHDGHSIVGEYLVIFK